MTRDDLKNYRNNQIWIDGRIEYLESYRNNINKLSSVYYNTPKRE